MRIAIIGPAPPYRGGISHHTTMLARYLRERGHEVDLVTFTRQYPKLLYPGKFQEEAAGSEVDGAGETSERMIDSLNPLTWHQTGRRLAARGYDLHIFKFWLPFFAPAFGVIARRLRASAPVLVVVDNLIPHERRPGDVSFTKFFFRYCDMAITQSSTVSRQFGEYFPSIPEIMLPHPTYEQFGERLPLETVRRELGISARHVLLFFGFVRRYKGLDRLFRAMPEIVRRLGDVQLLVVGEFFDPREEYEKILREAGVLQHVTIVDRYVPNEEVARWFSAADMLVLPYHSATNSGIVQIGYNFATPAIVTDVGSLSEVVIDGRTGFVLQEATPDAIADAVERMYDGDTIERFSSNIVEERKKYSWGSFADRLVEFARENMRP